MGNLRIEDKKLNKGFEVSLINPRTMDAMI